MQLDMADVKPSILSWAIVGIMALTFIVFAKWLFSRFPIKGLSDIVAAA